MIKYKAYIYCIEKKFLNSPFFKYSLIILHITTFYTRNNYFYIIITYFTYLKSVMIITFNFYSVILLFNLFLFSNIIIQLIHWEINYV